MNKHTPTPWKIRDAGTRERMLNIDYENGNFRSIVARLCDDDLCPEHGTLDGNAEFIVRAVNSHDALLAACQAVYNDPYTTCACAEKVRAAITLAMGNESGKE